MIKPMKNHDWGICTDCRYFAEMGEFSGCDRGGDPFSKVPTCDLFEPVGNCYTCARKVAEYNTRGVRVIECMDCGSTRFVRFRGRCREYRETRI